jgi:MFS transporter, DHA1 family, inner membrane transport protein
MYLLSAGRERSLMWLLVLTQLTLVVDFMVMMPLGPQIIHALSITPSEFAAAVSAYALCSGVSGLLGATYIDRCDRRTLLLTVYALFALSNLACACATSYSMLVAARAFAGLSGGALGAVVVTIVGDVIPVERRGAAQGTISLAFSLSSIAGVPVGVLLGAQFGWTAPFVFLVILSAATWLVSARMVPELKAHLTRQPIQRRQVCSELLELLGNSRHLNAFALTFIMMVSHMLVTPFASSALVANYGVEPSHLSWLYMTGGVATLLSSPWVGRLADRYGNQRVFRAALLMSTLAVLFLTHLPDVSFSVILLFFPFYMMSMSGRMVPMQALLSTVPEAATRGAFLSVNSAIQSLGIGCGAWLGGLMLSTHANGQIEGYGNAGWAAVGLALLAFAWISRVSATADLAAGRPAIQR